MGGGRGVRYFAFSHIQKLFLMTSVVRGSFVMTDF